MVDYKAQYLKYKFKYLQAKDLSKNKLKNKNFKGGNGEEILMSVLGIGALAAGLAYYKYTNKTNKVNEFSDFCQKAIDLDRPCEENETIVKCKREIARKYPAEAQGTSTNAELIEKYKKLTSSLIGTDEEKQQTETCYN